MLNLAVRRYITAVYKDKSSSDSAQIPAAATIELHRIGANLTAAFSLAPGTDSDSIAVDDPGRIQAGDSVQVFSGGTLRTTQLLSVESVNSDGTLSIANTSGTVTAAGSAGDRLVVTSGPLTVYPTQAASGSGSTSFSTDVTGLAQCYTREKRFDAIITISGLAPRVIVDAQGLPVTSPSSWVNAADFPSLGAAIAQVPTGGTLFIPAGDRTVPSGGLVVNRPITIQGEVGTRLFSYSPATNQPVINLVPGGVELSGVVIRDLTLLNTSRPSSPAAGNYGIQADVPTDGSKISRLTIERVGIVNMGDDAIHLHAHATNDSFFVFVALRDVSCTLARGNGLYATYANLLNCYGCYFNSNAREGLHAENSEVACYSCAFESNCTTSDTTGSFLLNATFNGQASVQSCSISRFDGCHFESFTGDSQPVTKRGIVINNSTGGAVSGCVFFNGSENTGTNDNGERGVFCTFSARGPTDPSTPGVLACSILSNSFTNVRVPVEVDAGTTTTQAAQDCVVFPQRVDTTVSGTGDMKLPVGLSDSGVVALGRRRKATGSLVELDRGVFLPPRAMTGSSGEKLTGDDAGYILFDSSNKVLKLWDGTNWLTLVTAP